MRAHLRMLSACALLAGLSVVSGASAQAPPVPDSTALPPWPVAPTQAARPPVVRFDDEKRESPSVARLLKATDVRTETSDTGELVAHLPLGALVTRLASRGGYAVLVEFDDPEDAHARLVGWVPVTFLVLLPKVLPPPAAPGPTPDDGKITVHINSVPGVTLEKLIAGGWWEVCRVPCDVRLPPDASYRIHGNGVQPSRTFMLAPVGGGAVLHVEPASSDAGAGLALIGLGGAVMVGSLFGGVAAVFGGSSDAASVALYSIAGGGVLLCVIGTVVLGARGKTTVTQPKTPSTTRLPTWSTGLERTPSSGSPLVIPLLSATF